MTLRAKVFSKDGNRFLIPGFWCDEDNDDWQGMSISSITIEGMMMNVVARFDSVTEWIDLPIDPDGDVSIPHVKHQLLGRCFAHGGIDILLISGPLFDAVKTQELSNAQ